MSCNTAVAKTRQQQARIACMLLLCSAMIGCMNDENTKYGIEGMVSLDGRPTVKSSLRFTPDPANEIKGPQAFAFAKHGSFQIDAEQGLVKGQYLVRVEVVDETDNIIGVASKTITVEPKADNSFSITLTTADLDAHQTHGDEDGEEEDE